MLGYGQQQSYYPAANPPGIYPYSVQQGGYMASRPAQTNGPAIASLVLGIIGVVTCWIPFIGLVVSIVGLVLASIGMKRIDSKGLAIAGLVLSIIGVVFSACPTVALFGLIHVPY
jgi:hypothetical protein